MVLAPICTPSTNDIEGYKTRFAKQHGGGMGGDI